MNGIFGICSEGDCVEKLYDGTADVGHRGQEYGGLATSDGEKIHIRTHHGLFSRAFLNDLQGMEGRFGIGHASSWDRQPISKHARFGEFILGFDGYIINSHDLRSDLMFDGYSFANLEDIELLAALIGKARDPLEGIEQALLKVAGPCNLTMLTTEGVYAARSMHGLKPLVLGRNGSTWAVASETSAFNNDTGLERVRDFKPGEIILLDGKEAKSLKVLGGKPSFCSFEWIYFGGPDSVIEGISVTDVRHNLGKFLAQDDGVEADIVAAVLNSGILHAEGYHLESRLPSVKVFRPLRYVWRTYIRPINERKVEKKRKFRTIASNVKGKRIILVDDSIRSGITTQGLNQLLWDAGAKEVHDRISSPPSIRDCPYDRPPLEEERFIAAYKNIEEIRRFIGANTLRYQRLEKVPEAIGLPKENLCLDCFLPGS